MEFTGERYLPDQTDSRDELSVEHLHRYNSVLPLIKGKVVLDIACGEGYGSALMAKTAKSVIGVDISDECILHASSAYNTTDYPNLLFQKGEAERIPAHDNSFDVVVSFETIEHISADSQKIFLAEVKRVLKKGGLFIISTPDQDNYSNRYEHVNEFHLHELKRDEFKALLSQNFAYAQFYEQGFEVISLLTPADYSRIDQLRLINWQKKVQPKKGKYLIAIASDKPITGNAMASVVLDTEKDYLKLMDRIIQLQQEVENLSSWGIKLDGERVQHETIITTLKEQIHLFKKQDIKEIAFRLDALQQLFSKHDKEKQTLIDSLLANLDQHRKEILQQQDALRTRDSEMAGLWIKVNELAAQLTAQADKTRLLEGEKELLETEQSLLQAKNKSLEDQLSEMLLNMKSMQAHSNLINEELIVRNNTNSALREQLEKQSSDNESLETKRRELDSRLNEKEQLFQDLQFNYHLTQQQLTEHNNKLATIYGSDGWKLLNRYYNLKGKYLNENSVHYKLLRKTLNLLRGRKMEPVLKRLPTSDILKSNAGQATNAVSIPVRPLPYYENPDVSIIIPVFNAWEMNSKCVESILVNTGDVTYEVIVADDGSTDPTSDIAKHFPNIVHIRNENNMGFLKNCNNATSYAKGKYLYILNNDTEVKPGWLSSLVMLMEKDKTIGMTGSKFIYPDGRLQEAGGIIWKDASGWNYGNGQDPGLPQFNYVKEVDYISGAGIMLRTELWRELGGFDVRYSPAYCEDSDLAFAVREKGLRVVYQPLSEIIHYEGYSHGSDKIESHISSIKKYQEINNKKFFEKWKTVLERDHFHNAENVFWAKDRSRSKKTLLMVDHYVPQFDKDAGSRTTFQYLQLLVKLGFNVKFMGENFYRHEPYTTILQQMGIEVLYGPWYANNWKQWFIENNDKFDYVYLNRPHITINIIDFFKEHSRAKIIYYGHDLHFIRELKQYEIEKDKTLLKSSEKWKETETYIFNKADIILAPSKDEKQLIKKLGINGKVYSIKPYLFESVPSPMEDFTGKKDILFVGGFNHKPNVDAVLWFVENIWPRFTQQIADARFIVVGSNAPKEILELSGNSVEVRGFVSDDELNRLYASTRIVVIPLRYGAGVKGKTIEAMYNGIPLVTTSYGIEGLPGDISFIHAKDDAVNFLQELTRIYSLPDKSLAALSALEIEYIRDNFHFDIVKAELLDILNAHQ